MRDSQVCPKISSIQLSNKPKMHKLVNYSGFDNKYQDHLRIRNKLYSTATKSEKIVTSTVLSINGLKIFFTT